MHNTLAKSYWAARYTCIISIMTRLYQTHCRHIILLIVERAPKRNSLYYTSLYIIYFYSMLWLSNLFYMTSVEIAENKMIGCVLQVIKYRDILVVWIHLSLYITLFHSMRWRSSLFYITSVEIAERLEHEN